MAEESAAKETAAASESKAAKPVLLYALVVINMLVVAGVGAMIHLGRQKDAQQATIEKVVEGEAQAQAEEREKSDEFIGKMIPMETFYVNLAGNRGTRLLKVNMEMEVESERVIEEIEKRKPQIRDIIIIILSSKTFKDLESREGKEGLRDEIKDAVNSFLTKGKIKHVHFTEFIYN
ncbi:MAG: flagellar basal body-associated FliL family protein [Bdellovibrionales bacterium]|nr:flagellar basal body-associated FliL family protein [Bdellovibrionales bacterium]